MTNKKPSFTIANSSTIVLLAAREGITIADALTKWNNENGKTFTMDALLTKLTKRAAQDAKPAAKPEGPTKAHLANVTKAKEFAAWLAKNPRPFGLADISAHVRFCEKSQQATNVVRVLLTDGIVKKFGTKNGRTVYAPIDYVEPDTTDIAE